VPPSESVAAASGGRLVKALTFAGRQSVRFESVAEPAIEDAADVIVGVRLTAVCGSDLHVYHERERGLDPGTVLGHEVVGEVLEVGPAVGTLEPGNRVASPFTTSCGQCFYCQRGLTCRCAVGQLFGWVEEGKGLQGTQAERVRVPLADSTLLALPEDVSDEEGLLLGDVLSTGYFCAELAGVDSSGVYVVLGCGPVGLMAIVATRHRGAERIYAVDAVPERLELARGFGAVPVSYEAGSPFAVIGEATEGRGADAVLEVVGSPAATRLAVDLVRPGGVVASVGVHTEARFAFSPVEAYDKNLTYRSGRCPARHYMERLLPLVRQGRYPLSSVISHRLALEDGPEGYALFDAKQDGCTKVVLKP
jgi:threonine dehydrogenase-like Zn-dependent dehydrogenase